MSEKLSELVLGAGPRPLKRIYNKERAQEWENPTFVDLEPLPGYVQWDLNNIPYPFGDASFDEIHAYEVLEHLGSLGDWKFFFDQFNEMGRILRPGGLLCGSVPHTTSPWLFGDPGHRRVITENTFQYLDRDFYGEGRTMSEHYKAFLKVSWKVDFQQLLEEAGMLLFALKRE
jgi:predicted SAM-dependent methyltransferase